MLEARDRVGGRTLNHPVGRGEVVEVGGEWVGPGQDRIMARAKALGINTFKTYTKGEQILEYAGRQTHFTGLDPAAARAGRERLRPVCSASSSTCRRPSRSTGRGRRRTRRRSTAQTLETFKLANSTTAGARFLLDLAIKAVFAAEPRDLSLLHALFYFNSGQRDHQPHAAPRAAPRTRGFVGGSQLVSIRMAERLGGRVVLGAPVRRIAQSRGGVAVDSDAGAWRARRVIVALAPMLAGRIDYEPALPALRDGLTQRVPQGSVIKFEAVYPTPFWRADGLNGYATATSPRSASRTTTLRRAASPACCWGSSSARTRAGWAPSERPLAAARCSPTSSSCSAGAPPGRGR